MTEQEQIEVLKQRLETLEIQHNNLRVYTQSAIDDLTATLAKAVECLDRLVPKR